MYLCHVLLNYLFYTFPSVNPITNRLTKYVFRSQILKKQKRAGCCNSHCHHTGFTFYNVYISRPLSVFIFEWIFSMCACVCMWLIVKSFFYSSLNHVASVAFCFSFKKLWSYCILNVFMFYFRYTNVFSFMAVYGHCRNVAEM